MIHLTIGNIKRAKAERGEGGDHLFLTTLEQGAYTRVALLLPPGTADAVAACINVAVAAGQPTKKPEGIAL